jgi:hypothetical protein
MSFETEKHKIYTIWQDSNKNSIQVETLKKLEDVKNKQVKFILPSDLQLNNLRSINSDWMPLLEMLPVGVNVTIITQRNIDFIVECIIPEKMIPYARFNLAYRRIDGINVFLGKQNYLNQFSQIIDIQKKNKFGLPDSNYVQNLKRVIWNTSFIQINNSPSVYPWYDIEFKLFFTLINPFRISVS